MSHRLNMLFALCAVGALASPATAAAADIDCEMRFDLSSWSVFYKSSSGDGVITCNNGQTMAVRLEARGGGLSIGKSKLKNGRGEFSGVSDISELLGSYASAEASAGAGAAAKGQGAGQHLEQDQSQRIEVAAPVQGFSPRLLG